MGIKFDLMTLTIKIHLIYAKETSSTLVRLLPPGSGNI